MVMALRNATAVWSLAIRGADDMPQIIALQAHKRRRARVQVALDDGGSFSLAPLLAARLHLGQPLDATQIAQLQAEDESTRAVEQAARFLGRRPHSAAELRHKLRQKDFAEDAITAALERMRQQGYVDDQAFARFWVEDRLRFRPMGLRALRHGLRQKGVAAAVIEAALADVDSADAAWRAARSRLRRLRHLAPEAQRNKLWAFLQRRGFAADLCHEVVAGVLAESGECESVRHSDGHEEQASWES